MGLLSGKQYLHYDPWEPVDLCRPASADFIRATATLLVGWFHIWQQSWIGAGKYDWLPRSGAAMVDVLIMLSAFCLFLPYAKPAAHRQPLPLCRPAPFYLRRAARILPSYYLSLLASLLIALARSGWNARLGLDLAAHLTMTQMFFPDAYTATQLNGVTWTLTVFTLFYLIFPLLARLAAVFPVQSITGLMAVQIVWSQWVLSQFGEARYSILFNQFPAFCGVFAIGFLAAWALAVLQAFSPLRSKSARVCLSLLGAAAFWRMCCLLYTQALAENYQQVQLENRLPLTAAAACCMVCLALGVTLPFRRLWSFLSGISFNFYLWHQMLAVWIKYDLRIPSWTGDTPPNQLGDRTWMHQSNAIYWAVGVAAAVFFTYAVERPAAGYLKQQAPALLRRCACRAKNTRFGSAKPPDSSAD